MICGGSLSLIVGLFGSRTDSCHGVTLSFHSTGSTQCGLPLKSQFCAMHSTGSQPAACSARVSLNTSTGSCVLPDRNWPTNHQIAGAPTWYWCLMLNSLRIASHVLLSKRSIGSFSALRIFLL